MKLLITGAFNAKDEQLKILSNVGYEVVFMQNESEDIACPYEEIEGVICNGLFLYHDIKKFKNLKFIQLTSAGFDRVPLDEITARGIKIFNARGVYSIPMAEFCLFSVLSLYKGLNFFAQNQTEKEWVKNREVKEIFSQSVLIVGAGSVGTECAKRFKAMGCNVIGVDLYPRADESFEKIYPLCELNNLLSMADVVVLTLPLTSETRGIINEKTFSNFKRGSVLVNISRGAVVNETALIKALQDGTLSGACLDVFEVEPLPSSSPLWDYKNVIITPHNSFIGNGNNQRLFNLILENIRNL